MSDNENQPVQATDDLPHIYTQSEAFSVDPYSEAMVAINVIVKAALNIDFGAMNEKESQNLNAILETIEDVDPDSAGLGL